LRWDTQDTHLMTPQTTSQQTGTARMPAWGVQWPLLPAAGEAALQMLPHPVLHSPP
jgi:hypothetical protein